MNKDYELKVEEVSPETLLEAAKLLRKNYERKTGKSFSTTGQRDYQAIFYRTINQHHKHFLMKHLKRFIATLAITVLPFHSYVNGCGGDFYDYMNYYNLFDQLLLENKGLQPFLLTTDDAFYGEDMNPDGETTAARRKYKRMDDIFQEEQNPSGHE